MTVMSSTSCLKPFRSEDRSEILGREIRQAETQKIPFLLARRGQEEADGSVAPHLGKGPKASAPAQDLDAVETRLAESTDLWRAVPFD